MTGFSKKLHVLEIRIDKLRRSLKNLPRMCLQMSGTYRVVPSSMRAVIGRILAAQS
jgi:hypothetical protein